MYRLRVVVEEIKGFCDLPAKVGDYFEVDGGRLLIPPGKHLCIWALQALMPLLTVKQRNINEPNDWTPNTSRVVCPDPNGLVIYRIDRVGSGSDDLSALSCESGSEDGNRETRSDGDAGSLCAPDNDIPPRLLTSPEKCTGCQRCELACSFAHSGTYAPNLSRIQINRDDHTGKDVPVVCRQCGTARCVAACPPGALSRDQVTHAVILDGQKCMRCGLCRTACPFGAIHLGPGGYPQVCDLCGGDPQCVQACPTGAIRFGRAGEPGDAPRFEQPGKQPPKNPGKGLAETGFGE